MSALQNRVQEVVNHIQFRARCCEIEFEYLILKNLKQSIGSNSI